MRIAKVSEGSTTVVGCWYVYPSFGVRHETWAIGRSKQEGRECGYRSESRGKEVAET